MLGGNPEEVEAWKTRTAAQANIRWLGHVPNAESTAVSGGLRRAAHAVSARGDDPRQGQHRRDHEPDEIVRVHGRRTGDPFQRSCRAARDAQRRQQHSASPGRSRRLGGCACETPEESRKNGNASPPRPGPTSARFPGAAASNGFSNSPPAIMDKLIYIARSRIPSNRANCIQTLKMCSGFAAHIPVELIAPYYPEDARQKADLRERFALARDFDVTWVPFPHWGERFAVRGYALAAALRARLQKRALRAHARTVVRILAGAGGRAGGFRSPLPGGRPALPRMAKAGGRSAAFPGAAGNLLHLEIPDRGLRRRRRAPRAPAPCARRGGPAAVRTGGRKA